MRLLLLLILLAGIAGATYPWMASGLAGGEIGSVEVFDPENGFRPAIVHLSASDAPVQVLVELTAARPFDVAKDRAVLTLTVNAGSRTVLAETLSFAEASPRQTSPQLPERVYREDAGTIASIGDGDYTFTVGAGDAAGIDISSVELVLRSGPPAIDPRIQPIGFALMAIGFVGLVLSFRRGRDPGNPNSEPPKPRWGRGGQPR